MKMKDKKGVDYKMNSMLLWWVERAARARTVGNRIEGLVFARLEDRARMSSLAINLEVLLGASFFFLES